MEKQMTHTKGKRREEGINNIKEGLLIVSMFLCLFCAVGIFGA